jgi:hypothetical protein
MMRLSYDTPDEKEDDAKIGVLAACANAVLGHEPEAGRLDDMLQDRECRSANIFACLDRRNCVR